MDISNSKVCICTHFLVYGAPQALRDYLLEKRVRSLSFIAHPIYVDGSKSSFEKSVRGKVIYKTTFPLRLKANLICYFFEQLLSLWWLFTDNTKYDLFVGVDSLNALTGIILRHLGKASQVVYYTIDFVPRRFNNPVLNWFYHKLDLHCANHCDYVWNVSKRIGEGRQSFGKVRRDNESVVPIGVWPQQKRRQKLSSTKKLLFVGSLVEKQGVQLVIKAMPKVIKKISNFHFLIVGGGPYEEGLKSLVKKYRLGKYVTFTGWVKDRSRLDEYLKEGDLAVAMYDKGEDTFTYYADPTKLKDYLSFGIPILLTDVPHNANDIVAAGAGELVDYDSRVLADKIIFLMEDNLRLSEYRNNALKYIQKYTWEKIFNNQFKNL